MLPRFIAIAGSSKGNVFILDDGEVFVGREASNSVHIADPSISRRHCRIESEAGRFKIIDLDSFNGTFVNGVPVKEQFLAHGDQIAVGNILLIFLLDEADAETALKHVQLDEERLTARSTIRLQREEALYLQPERVLATLQPAERVARDLNALLKISATVNTIRDPEALQQQLLEAIFEIVPAERGAIILAGTDGEELISVLGRDKSSDSDQPVRVSRTIVSQVLREGVAILSNGILESEPFGGAESLIASQTRSLLCVPLRIFDKSLGVVYLSTSNPVADFDEDHLQLVTAIAAISAVALENARHVEWLEGENRRLRAEVRLEHNMIGESAPMREVYGLIAKVAPTDSTVLIRGESGTGKELAAHAIHLNSPRAARPFVAINCATLTEALLESELFGHEKGAFTGATAQKKGKLEVADGGTLFLDEAGELSPTLQAKLLRVLQEREFERVGGTRPVKVDIRVVAATNRNLEEAVKSGGFRQDLYYRLNVVSFVMPPLRERREDIPLLTSYFIAKCSKKCKRRVTGVSPEARICFLDYDWTGNVRELENAIERAVVLGSAESIEVEDLPESIVEASTSGATSAAEFYGAIKETKKQLVLKAIKQANGNYTEAAKTLGVHPNNLHRLVRTMNLKDTVKNS